MQRATGITSAQQGPASFAKTHSTGNQADAVNKMSFDEFRKSWRQQRDNNANPSLRYFNHQNDEFKFCVLTLANRETPKTFSQEEIGQPFEYFDEYRRELIIIAMNKMARWGKILPRQFSTADCFLPE